MRGTPATATQSSPWRALWPPPEGNRWKQAGVDGPGKAEGTAGPLREHGRSPAWLVCTASCGWMPCALALPELWMEG